MGLKSGACCKYLTSISRVSHKLSQASIYWLELLVWVTPQTERVIVLSKILALNESPVCYQPPAWEQQSNNYRSRIGCHNNFDKVKDALHVRGRFWNMMLMLFYLNVFYLPTLTDFVGHTSCGMR